MITLRHILIHTHSQTHRHTQKHTHTNKCTHTHTIKQPKNTWKHKQNCAKTHKRTHTNIHKHININKNMHRNTHTNTNTHTKTHTHINTYTNTHKPAKNLHTFTHSLLLNSKKLTQTFTNKQRKKFYFLIFWILQ